MWYIFQIRRFHMAKLNSLILILFFLYYFGPAFSSELNNEASQSTPYTLEYVKDKPAWAKKKGIPKQEDKIFIAKGFNINSTDKKEVEDKVEYSTIKMQSDIVSAFRNSFARQTDKNELERYVIPNIFYERVAVREDGKKLYLLLGVNRADVEATVRSALHDPYNRFEGYLKDQNVCLTQSAACFNDIQIILNDSVEALDNQKQILAKLTNGAENGHNPLHSNLDVYQEKAVELINTLKKDLKRAYLIEIVTEKPKWLKDTHHPKREGVVFAADFFTTPLDIQSQTPIHGLFGPLLVDIVIGASQRRLKQKTVYIDDTIIFLFAHKFISDLTSKFRKEFARGVDEDKLEGYVIQNMFYERVAVREDGKKLYLLLGVNRADVEAAVRSALHDSYGRFEGYFKDQNVCLTQSVACFNDIQSILNDSVETLDNQKQILAELTNGAENGHNPLHSNLAVYQEKAVELINTLKKDLDRAYLVEVVIEEPRWLKDTHHTKRKGVVFAADYYTVGGGVPNSPFFSLNFELYVSNIINTKTIHTANGATTALLGDKFHSMQRAAISGSIISKSTELHSALTSKFRKEFARGVDEDELERYVIPNIFYERVAVRSDRGRLYLLLGVNRADVEAAVRSALHDSYSRFENYLKNPRACYTQSLTCFMDVQQILNDDADAIEDRKEILSKLTNGADDGHNPLHNNLATYKEQALGFVNELKDDVPIILTVASHRMADVVVKNVQGIATSGTAGESKDAGIADSFLIRNLLKTFANNGYNNVTVREDSPELSSILQRKEAIYVNVDYSSSALFVFVGFIPAGWNVRFNYRLTFSLGKSVHAYNDYYTSDYPKFPLSDEVKNTLTQKMSNKVINIFKESHPVLFNSYIKK